MIIGLETNQRLSDVIILNQEAVEQAVFVSWSWENGVNLTNTHNKKQLLTFD